MVMFTVFKNHSFLFLIIKLVIFLVENLESIEMHLYTYTHPKVCNVYNKLGYLSLYVFFNIFIKWREQIFFQSRLFPQKLNRVIIWSSSFTPSYVPKRVKNVYMATCAWMYIATSRRIARTCKHPKCPSTDEWTNEIYPTLDYYLAIKKWMSYWYLLHRVWTLKTY